MDFVVEIEDETGLVNLHPVGSGGFQPLENFGVDGSKTVKQCQRTEIFVPGLGEMEKR